MKRIIFFIPVIILLIILIFKTPLLNGNDGNIYDSTPDSAVNIYFINPTKFEVLNGYNLPVQKIPLEYFSIRVAPGEYEPLSLLISSNRSLKQVEVEISDLFSGSN